MHNRHSSKVISINAAKPRVASELLLSSVLNLISNYGTLADKDSDAALRSAAAIELQLRTLAGLPDMEPILRATCHQLSEQWGMLLEQHAPKPKPSTFISRLISGPPPHRTN